MVRPRPWSLVLPVLAAAAPAQWSDTAPEDPNKQARRLVSFLEIPQRRREASAQLLRLGPAAVAPLCAKLTDPRPDVVFRILHALRTLGPVAAAALPHLERLGKSDDAGLARGAQWCALGIRATGVTLVVDRTEQVVQLVDAAGKVVRSTGKIAAIYDAELLPGDRLLVCRVSGEVAEMDKEGKVLWKYDAGTALDADRLADGNTLISCGKKGKVIEVDPAGKVVWSFESTWPNDVDRLPSGTTLVSDYKARRLVEVDRDGNVVWTVATPEGTIDAERLPNGDTLMVLSDTGAVRVVDPDGRTVREFKDVDQPQCAVGLPGGHVLVGGSGEWQELDAAGKVLHSRTVKGMVSSLHRY